MTTPTLALTDSQGVERKVQCELPRGLMQCWAWLPARQLVARVAVSLTSLDVADALVKEAEEYRTADGGFIASQLLTDADMLAADAAASDALDFVVLRLGLLPAWREPPCSPGQRNCGHYGAHRTATDQQRDVLVEALRVLTPIADMRWAEEERWGAIRRFYGQVDRATLSGMPAQAPTMLGSAVTASSLLSMYVERLCEQAEQWSRERAEEQARQAQKAPHA